MQFQSACTSPQIYNWNILVCDVKEPIQQQIQQQIIANNNLQQV